MEIRERVYRERLLRRLRPYFPAGARVLDAGCGPGDGAEMLAELGCRVVALDVEAHPEDWARRARPEIEFRQGSAESLDFPDAAFDAIWVMDALHHMENPGRALAELLRVAKPGAPVAVIESNRRNPLLYLRMTLIAGHRTFTRRRLRGLLDQAGAQYKFFMAESRCLPWNWPWALALLNAWGDLAEGLRLLDPWLTYQIAVVPGLGRRPGSGEQARP